MTSEPNVGIRHIPQPGDLFQSTIDMAVWEVMMVAEQPRVVLRRLMPAHCKDRPHALGGSVGCKNFAHLVPLVQATTKD